MRHGNGRGIQGLPDNHIYKDKGCSYHPACLTCPFFVCRYDDREEMKAAVQTAHDNGASVQQLTTRLWLGERAIYRLLQKEKHE